MAIDHLLRRAGFGASSAELAAYEQLSYSQAVDRLINYQSIPDDVESKIGQPGYVGTTSNGPFSPDTVITDARQRWLFRMVHSQRPLQEKMALFWHNHFATGYTKIAGVISAANATRVMAAKASEDPAGQQGQIEPRRRKAGIAIERRGEGFLRLLQRTLFLQCPTLDQHQLGVVGLRRFERRDLLERLGQAIDLQ